jgi:hypothetical protein
MLRSAVCILAISTGLIMHEPVQAATLTLAAPISQANMITEMSQAVLKEAASRLGYELIIKPLPPERALVLINTGLLDGDSLRSTDLDLRPFPNLIRVNVPIADDDLVAYGIGKVLRPTSIKSIKPYSVASTHIKEMDQLGSSYHFSFVESKIQAFQMLRLGRVQLVVLPRSTFCEVIAAGYTPCVRIVEMIPFSGISI